MLPVPGFFSSICFDKEQVPSEARLRRKSQLSGGLLTFLEKQQSEVLDRIIQDAMTQGELRLDDRLASTTMQQKLRRFVQFQQKLGLIPVQAELVALTSDGGKTTLSNSKFQALAQSRSTSFPLSNRAVTSTDDVLPIWALIYHYLRIGKLDLALKELSEERSVLSGEREISIVLRAIAEQLKENQSLPLSSASAAHRTPSSK
jgi:hypothetical protein